MDSDRLKSLLNEIKDEIMKEISSLRETTVKQHNDLKSDFLAFKTSVLTQVNALDGALKKTIVSQETHSKQIVELMKSQEFISSTIEETKNYTAANVSNIIKSNKNLEKENQMKSQEFISSTIEETKNYTAANVSNIIKSNKNLEKENQILNQKLNELITTTNTNAQNIINQEHVEKWLKQMEYPKLLKKMLIRLY